MVALTLSEFDCRAPGLPPYFLRPPTTAFRRHRLSELGVDQNGLLGQSPLLTRVLPPTVVVPWLLDAQRPDVPVGAAIHVTARRHLQHRRRALAVTDHLAAGTQAGITAADVLTSNGVMRD